MNSLILIVFALFISYVTSEPNPKVKTKLGELEGTWKSSTKGKKYASFEGVPYARRPVGKYRFRAPQEAKPWPGVWNASRTQAPCLQYEPFEAKILGSEDCLFINIYTPNVKPGNNYPIFVFIHGGAFMYGSGGIYNPKNIMDWDFVMVTFNYRLGPLGFLSTEDESSPGNAGLKDQAMAMRWIQENAAAFGGDKTSVTLTGCSAGGASVHYHYLSPLSKGTFSRGISFSGSAFSSWTHSIRPAEKARRLASLVGCPTSDTRGMIDCLRTRPAEAIVNAQIDMFDWTVHMFTPFTPTAEPADTKGAFLTQYPYKASTAGVMQQVPLIAGVTTKEGLYPAAYYQRNNSILAELEARWEELASNIFEYNDTLPPNLRRDVAAKIKSHYLSNRPVSQATFDQLVDALSDRLFVADVGRLAQIHAKTSGQPVYLYRYGFRGEKSLTNLMANNDYNYGASHADDELHIFPFEGLESKSSEDRLITETLLNMIYSYSTAGKPKLPENSPEWMPLKPGAEDIHYLEITSPTKMEIKSSADFGQRSFWDSLGFIENHNYVPETRVKDEF